MKQKGFTLIELLVVIAIISLLTSASFASIQEAREKSRMAQGLVTTRALRDAAEIYFDDMGFYPPDVNRGWDPGFMQALPTNHATGATSNVCDDCPADWLTTLAARWHGPYVSSWTITSPWGGNIRLQQLEFASRSIWLHCPGRRIYRNRTRCFR